MSLKSIDMQMAVHKSADAGRMQRDIQQKPEQDQAQLSAQQVKQTEIRSHASEKTEKSAHSGIKNSDPHKGGQQQGADPHKERSSQAHAEETHTPEHPYKGRHIDLTL
jgi:hypothetical protein